MILQATHTHLYPGHRGTVSGLECVADLRAQTDCLVEFSDGSAAAASINGSGRDWYIRTGAYRTAAGTEIAEKRWRIRFDESGGEIGFHIIKPA